MALGKSGLKKEEARETAPEELIMSRGGVLDPGEKFTGTGCLLQECVLSQGRKSGGSARLFSLSNKGKKDFTESHPA